MLPAIPDFDIDYFRAKRDGILAEMADSGRDPEGFAFAAQIQTGTTDVSRAAAVEAGVAFAAAGATHLILGMPARLGPAGLDALAQRVAEPLRDALG